MAEKKKFLLRIRPDLWEDLSRWAAEDFRSVNAQIEFILHGAVRDRGKARRSRDPDEDRPGRG